MKTISTTRVSGDRLLFTGAGQMHLRTTGCTVAQWEGVGIQPAELARFPSLTKAQRDELATEDLDEPTAETEQALRAVIAAIRQAKTERYRARGRGGYAINAHRRQEDFDRRPDGRVDHGAVSTSFGDLCTCGRYGILRVNGWRVCCQCGRLEKTRDNNC